MAPVTVRDAVDGDRDAVRELCERLDPRDYVPSAWDEWRTNPQNRMFVALAEGRLVGCVHAGLVAPGQVFSQALRVDALWHRAGVATALMLEQRTRLAARGIRATRGVTAVANVRARAFFATVDWRETATLRRRRLRDWNPAARGAAPADAPRGPIVVSIEGRAHFRRVYLEADTAWLAAAARDGRWHARDGAWLLLDAPSRAGATWIAALGGPAAALRELLRTLSPPWAPAGDLLVEAPDDPAIAAALDAAGFEDPAPQDAYVLVEDALQDRAAALTAPR
jgi:N-acetylglutamate synthase-like GNAT family acetyltransferase